MVQSMMEIGRKEREMGLVPTVFLGQEEDLGRSTQEGGKMI